MTLGAWIIASAPWHAAHASRSNMSTNPRNCVGIRPKDWIFLDLIAGHANTYTFSVASLINLGVNMPLFTQSSINSLGSPPRTANSEIKTFYFKYRLAEQKIRLLFTKAIGSDKLAERLVAGKTDFVASLFQTQSQRYKWLDITPLFIEYNKKQTYSQKIGAKS